jgi:ABC-type phosphate/phosphonate transport system substrate-binding protein
MKILTNLNSDQKQELEELLLKIENSKLEQQDFLDINIINTFHAIKKKFKRKYQN